MKRRKPGRSKLSRGKGPHAGPKPPGRNLAACRGKQTLKTLAEAEGAKTYAQYSHAGTDLRIYSCKACGLYHLATR